MTRQTAVRLVYGVEISEERAMLFSRVGIPDDLDKYDVFTDGYNGDSRTIFGKPVGTMKHLSSRERGQIKKDLSPFAKGRECKYFHLREDNQD